MLSMNDLHLGTHTDVSIDDLNIYHLNPRIGNVEIIKESIKKNGVFKPIIVNVGTHTGRPMEVLAGNHTLKALQILHNEEPDNPTYSTVATWQLDVDEEHATRIVLADNRTADLGGYDNDVLLELLDNLDGDYLGTGYDEGYIGALLGENTPEELPEAGDADVDNDPISYAIVIDCDSYGQQTRLLDQFIEEGLNCRAIM